MAVAPKSDSTTRTLGATATAFVVLWVAWWKPEWAALAASLAGVGVVVLYGVTDLRAVGAAAAVAVLFLGKDLLPAGTGDRWAWIAGLPGATAPAMARQPSWSELCIGATSLAGIVWWLALARGLMGEERVARLWSIAVAVTGAAVALWLLLQPAGAAEFGRSFSLGAMQSRNALGAALAMVALLGAGVALEEARQRKLNTLALWVVLAGASGWAAVALGSRGAWLCLLAGVAVLAWQHRRRWRVGMSAVSAVVLAAGVILWLEPQAAARVGEVGREYRWEIWRAAARIWTEHPWLGAGGGMFEPAFAWFSGLQPPVGATIRHPDSSLVLFVFEHGVGGVIVLAAALGVLFFPRGNSGDEADPARWRRGARAAVVAWLVAACVDISLHRAALLALGLLLVGVGWPRVATGRMSRAWGIALGIALGAVFLWSAQRIAAVPVAGAGYVRSSHEVRLAPEAARALVEHPLDVTLHHRLGRDAFVAGAYGVAAQHWRAVLELQPANEEGIRAYARALHRARPEEARPFWRHFFRHAEERAASRLEATLDELGRTDVAYWREVVRERPELFILLADEERPEARAAFVDWLRVDPRRRGEVPMRYVAAAFARWGDEPDFRAWVAVAPRWPWGEGLQSAQRLLEGGRSDLAWVLLSRMVKRPAPVKEVSRSVDARLLAQARPGDFSRLAELLGGDALRGAERVTALRAAVAQPNCPAWFRVELAYALADEGRRIEAGRELLVAARAMLGAQPGDW